MAIASLLTVEEARSYSHDFESSDAEMQSWIDAATIYLEKAIGPSIPVSDARVKLLCKLVVCDLDDVRSLSASEANTTRYLVRSMIQQLRTEVSMVVSEPDTSEEAGDES